MASTQLTPGRIIIPVRTPMATTLYELTMAKKSFKFTKKITHVDDMMIHNLVKYLVQTRFRL